MNDKLLLAALLGIAVGLDKEIFDEEEEQQEEEDEEEEYLED
jgi:hypothetical protein